MVRREVNVGIICACIPTLKPLVSRLIPKVTFVAPSSREQETDRPRRHRKKPVVAIHEIKMMSLSAKHSNGSVHPG